MVLQLIWEFTKVDSSLDKTRASSTVPVNCCPMMSSLAVEIRSVIPNQESLHSSVYFLSGLQFSKITITSIPKLFLPKCTAFGLNLEINNLSSKKITNCETMESFCKISALLSLKCAFSKLFSYAIGLRCQSLKPL